MLLLHKREPPLNLEEEIAGLDFLLQQVERAVESPLYPKYGKHEVGVHLHCDCKDWLKKRKTSAK